jgi:hypothetical protein
MNSRTVTQKLRHLSRDGIAWLRRRTSIPSLNFDRPFHLPIIGKLTVFNIGGNKVRLIAAIHYNRKRLYIRAVLTHEEYDQSKWKE